MTWNIDNALSHRHMSFYGTGKYLCVCLEHALLDCLFALSRTFVNIVLKYSTKQNVETSFKKCSNKEPDAWKFILTSKCILHIDSRWYRSDFRVVTIWHLAFVSPYHEVIYPGFGKIGFKCLLSGSDRLLHAGLCFKLIASQGFLKGSKKMEITQHEIPTVELPAAAP